MEYIYAALLVHAAGKKVTEDGVKGILKAAGINADDARVKALISALEEINIDEAIAKAAVAPVAAAAPATGAAAHTAPAAGEKKKEEKKEEKTEEEALAGLGALFG